MLKFAKKKLLILGDSISTNDIISYAKENGAYVIVTDYTPVEKSQAKQLADEAWNISTAETDKLYDMCIENKIDGVFAGVSEFNLEKAMILCNRLGLPFYAKKEQWDVLSDKAKFKQLCIKNGVPVTPEQSIYTGKGLDYDSIELPVIIKPVDGAGAVGISVCRNRQELENGIERAMQNSRKKEAIIEKFIESGNEVTSHYMIQNGEIYLFGLVERHLDNKQDEGISLPVAYTWKSKHLDRYIKEVDPAVRKMFNNMDIKNGVAFLQMFVDENGFYVYEMGYRLPGSQVYFFAKEMYGVSQMEMMVDYALLGHMNDHDVSKLANPYFEKSCCNLYFLLKPGKIKTIEGIDDIKNMPGVLNVIQLKREGDVIEKSGSLRQVFMRMHIIADNDNKLADLIREINSKIKVVSDNGENLLCNLFDPERLFNKSKGIVITDDFDESVKIGKELFSEHKKIYTDKLIDSIKLTVAKNMPDASEKEREDMFYHSVYDYWVYGATAGEEFYYNFYKLTDTEKREYITMREKVLYIHRLNDKNEAHILNNKYETYCRLKDYYKRDMISVKDESDFEAFCDFVTKHPTFVVKPLDLGLGIGVRKETVNPGENLREVFDEFLNEGKKYTEESHSSKGTSIILEEVINQSAELGCFHPESVNGVRVTTLRIGDKINIIYPWIKIGVNGDFVTSAFMGSIDAAIDVKTGIIDTIAMGEFGQREEYHPNSGLKIKGFQIPRWNELISIAKELAEALPKIPYVGWDFALTDDGWVLMEGNFTGDFMWQLFYERGTKKEFEKLIGWSLEKDFWWR